MKVIGFVGSPRKRGNADVLVDTFLEGAASAGAQTNKIFLADKEINQCMGCFRACTSKPGLRCQQHRDDMDPILDEMAASDLYLFASPLYCASYSAIMARFFERCLPCWEIEIVGELGTMEAFRFINTPFKGKKAVAGLVQDFKDPAPGQLAFQVYEHVMRPYMLELIDKIHVTDVRDVGDLRKKEDVLEQIFNKGKDLASAGKIINA
ncbi:MAG: flavodoxin family protein [Deltaproteobacteria bacterium]|nr:flavodoxin family protein [Deltaproteobacteria bacterium]